LPHARSPDAMVVMTDRLSGVQAKLSRADIHFDAIELAIREFVGSEPDLIPGEFDPHEHVYVFRAQRDSRSPTWVSPLMGDCVHNLRAALDYLMWELVKAGSGSGTSATEFPIFTDAERYRREAPKKTRGVPEGAERVLRALQPFAGASGGPFDPEWRDPEREPLALLQELERWDKHRSLNVTEDQVSAELVGFEQLGIMTSPHPALLPGRFTRGTVLARAAVPLARPDIEVYLRATYGVAFDRAGPGDGLAVVDTLRAIRQEVSGRVLPALSQFL